MLQCCTCSTVAEGVVDEAARGLAAALVEGSGARVWLRPRLTACFPPFGMLLPSSPPQNDGLRLRDAGRLVPPLLWYDGLTSPLPVPALALPLMCPLAVRVGAAKLPAEVVPTAAGCSVPIIGTPASRHARQACRREAYQCNGYVTCGYREAGDVVRKRRDTDVPCNCYFADQQQACSLAGRCTKQPHQ